MDRFHSMQIFIAVADTEGFASAARKLYMSPPAVTRTISALEDHLGVLLFHRTTRQVKLTDAGIRFLEDCRRILADLDEAEDSVAGAHRVPRGKLFITASSRFGCLHVAPLLIEFLERYPEISMQTLFVDRVVNLIDEGLDVAIRIGDLPDSTLTAIRVGSVRRVICASPEYLDARGIPQAPEDIAAHNIVQFSSLASKTEWHFKGSEGEITVPFSTRLTVNTADVAIAAAVAGCGLTLVLSYMITQEVVSGKLKIVLADYENASLPVHVVYQEGRKAAAKVRAFVDFAVDRLRAQTSIN
jgi:DNA-binding transcriptional LysR family regulator